MKSWVLKWHGGRTEVHSAGGMIGRTAFRVGRVGKERWLQPFYEAPWLDQGLAIESRLIANMRADYACVGLGRPHDAKDGLPLRWQAASRVPIAEEDGPITEADLLPHGYGVHHEWDLVRRSDRQLVLAINYPESSPITRLVRKITAFPDGIEVSMRIEARRRCRRPVGLHPNFALRSAPRSFHVEPGQFAFGITHPIGEPAVSLISPDAEFSDLAAVPLAGGGTCSLNDLPLPYATEEFVQLCGLDGRMSFTDRHDAVEWSLEWDSTQLPSCWLWISNWGRRHPPWNGRNACLGVILAAAPMNLGAQIAVAENPISTRGVATNVLITAQEPVTVSYRLRGRDLQS
ncbi:hypothetical protein [Rhizobium sp. CF142]|uniref:hypothetical protein n=1 Tax=Rhizobium sp. CF142 TaxID=1144314 RepID=UPI00026EECAB|nr:hypothetical protein [Rhizobium sp. CF142]EJJ31522.1 hypothetical protein PMI11_00244 [Rhizobium sp. CF142]